MAKTPHIGWLMIKRMGSKSEHTITYNGTLLQLLLLYFIFLITSGAASDSEKWDMSL